MSTPSPTPLNSAPDKADSAPGQPSQSTGQHSQLAQWLTRLAAGESSVAEVLAAITASPDDQAAIEGATVDLGRQSRCGFGEVIYGEGKPAELIHRIASVQIAAGQNVLVTRIDEKAAIQLQTEFEHSHHNSVAKTLRLSARSVTHDATIDPLSSSAPHVAVVTAGSTDAPVAAEATETLAWMGIDFASYDDIGVAGPQRLLSAVPKLQKAAAVIVVAGMEGALPSVVSGHLSVPIFAVPTSVGYGATLGGLTPLLGMLSSCAAGVAVVNIDAGFKAGYLAGLVIDQIRRVQSSKTT
ncbi:nickel pincer cofactor biosynthesis protein LarB [Planctomycetes bacterium K23_9]|uniref:AIR carboxylase n=1 Tax=Stieleria marina TaxID=1930275 RepID=A0A517NP29_9BACT|nr:AIR carboxylase [Planctomycetes bacterium K23_9]